MHHFMRRSLVSVGAAITISGAFTATAHLALAERPSGSAETCTASFDPMTLPDILAQAQRNGIPESSARGMFAKVDGNQDGWICQKRMPSPLLNHYNFVDNQAVGLARR